MLWVTQFSSKLRKSSWIKAHHSNEKSRWGAGRRARQVLHQIHSLCPYLSLPASWELLSGCSIPYLLLQHFIGPTETTGHSGGADWGWPSSHMAPCTKMTLCTKMFPDCCRASRDVKSKACNRSNMLLCWQEQWPLNRSQLCELFLEEENTTLTGDALHVAQSKMSFSISFFFHFFLSKTIRISKCRPSCWLVLRV